MPKVKPVAIAESYDPHGHLHSTIIDDRGCPWERRDDMPYGEWIALGDAWLPERKPPKRTRRAKKR